MSNDSKNTHQLNNWRGEFGDEYTIRNSADDKTMFARTKMWSRILDSIIGDLPETIVEVGSNLGLNLRALTQLTDARLIAIEPNKSALGKLVADGIIDKDDAHSAIAADIPLDDGIADLSFTSGVLIHISPDQLDESMAEIYRVSSKYVVCCEYFADKPEQIQYRGNDDLLFKRDFGDYWMESYPDLQLIDYGFLWKRMTGLDNITWWVFKKS
jgi:pseudaminic acid biosynthesis-associated methylase